MQHTYRDRIDAGRRLAGALERTGDRSGMIILGIPRGGIPVACEVARALRCPVDALVVRKIGHPGQPELAIGAVASGGVRVVSGSAASVRPELFEEIAAREAREVARRERALRGDRPAVDLQGERVILVDDGLATGSTMRAAIQAARAEGAEEVVVAVPVAPTRTVEDLADLADEVVCPSMPKAFFAISQFYARFGQTSDAEARELLEGSWQGDESANIEHKPTSREVVIPADGTELAGRLSVPSRAHGVVLFLHGSGSSRQSQRNGYVAEQLQRSGLATLLIDLLGAEEQRIDRRTHELRFDIELLATRAQSALRWLAADQEVRSPRVGLFGSSTGAAVALIAAAEMPDHVAAVVSRGGRPDLARRLGQVRAPTLLIVGGLDQAVMTLNREAAARLQVEHELAIVPGASHLFEERGALERVVQLSNAWFTRHLPRAPKARPTRSTGRLRPST